MTATLSPELVTIPNSSAIAKIGIPASDLSGTYDLVIAFHSNPEKLYRYSWEDEGEALRWIELLNDDQALMETSWGSLYHRALKHGDIEPIEV